MAEARRPRGERRAPGSRQAEPRPSSDPKIEFRPILVASSPRDTDGRLVLVDDHLVSVVVRLASEEHGASIGCWSVEAIFAPDASMPGRIFPTLEDVSVWVREHLIPPSRNPP